MPNFLIETELDSERIILFRQLLHGDPELSNKEYKTSSFIEKILEEYGLETRKIDNTGVLGILKGNGKGKKVVAYRADIDALPIEEKTGCNFSSKNKGIMHACGHDVHTAALLGAAKILSKYKEELNGEVRFIFQMDEEENGGAKRFIEAGALDGVDAVFGLHVDPNLKSGVVGVKHGKFYAASDMFDVEIIGKSAHGAKKEEGRDALLCACDIISKLNNISEAIEDQCVIHVGKIESGTARNIVADSAKFSGILRTLGNKTRTEVKNKLQELVTNCSKEYGCESKINLIESYAGIVNTDKEVDFVKTTLENLLGAKNVFTLKSPLMTTEDFGYYIEKCKGAYFHIGAGSNYPLHSNQFLPDENCLLKATACACEIIFNYLEG